MGYSAESALPAWTLRAANVSSDLFDARTFASNEEAVDFIANVLEASTEVPIIAIDSEGRIVLWNQGARRLYGYTPSEIVGQLHSVLHTQEDIGAGRPQPSSRIRLFATGNSEGSVERRRKDGSGSRPAWS